ncbi:MAG: hypothetical protein RDU20_18735, partial [Desulfomonilaceae bacterium]|nr:hypothetical protein [Desulfomonilaceae bacterium]
MEKRHKCGTRLCCILWEVQSSYVMSGGPLIRSSDTDTDASPEPRRLNVQGLRLLVLTTSFPSDETDWSGIFIAKLL